MFGFSIFAPIIPIMKPPMWAKNATPPCSDVIVAIDPNPENNCNTNQYPRIKGARISIIVTKNSTKMSVLIREYENNTKYAPSIPATAPEAPIIGIVDPGFMKYCAILPPMPAIK